MSLTLTLFVGATLLIAYLIRSFNQRNRNHWPKQGVTYVNAGSFLRKLLTGDLGFHVNDAPIYKYLKSQNLGFGGIMELWNPVLFITDLELMKNVYIKDFDQFSKRRGFNLEKHDPHLHKSLFNHKGQAWRTLRQIITPTFTTGKIRRMFSIFDNSAKNLALAVKRHLEETKSSNVEMREFLQKVTLDVITSSAFGVQSDIFDRPHDSKFYKMGKIMQQTFLGVNLVKFSFTAMLPGIAKFFPIKLIPREADEFFTDVIHKVLAHRRQTGEKREDFIQIMMEAQESLKNKPKDPEKEAALNDDGEGDSPYVDVDDDLIVSNSLLFIFGGFDTTEALLDFAMYELALNPDIQERLVKELEDARDDHGEFTYDSIYNLEYLDWIISEALRMYPPGTRTERKSATPYKIPDSDVTIPKNQIVALPVYQVHHDPEIWPEPEKFIPERFKKEEVAKRHIAAWQPFGLGPMNCVGSRFALMECKIAVAHLILNFKFEPCEKTSIPMKLITAGPLRPAEGMWLKVTPRR